MVTAAAAPRCFKRLCVSRRWSWPSPCPPNAHSETYESQGLRTDPTMHLDVAGSGSSACLGNT